MFCCGTIADDGQDGRDNGHDIHLKCVLACCGGTVADNDTADSKSKQRGVLCRARTKEKTKEKKQNKKQSRENCPKNRLMVFNKKSNDLETTIEETDLDKVRVIALF